MTSQRSVVVCTVEQWRAPSAETELTLRQAGCAPRGWKGGSTRDGDEVKLRQADVS